MNYKYFYTFFILLILFGIPTVFAVEDQVNKFDKKIYNPTDFGLKKVLFEARISDLTESLNNRLIFGKLKDVHFKVEMRNDKKGKVTVEGMPNGYEEIKSSLVALINPHLDSFIPTKLAEKIDGYKREVSGNEESLVLVKAKDTSGLKDIYQVDMYFNKENELVKSVSYSSVETNTSIYEYSKNEAKFDKIMLKKIIEKSRKSWGQEIEMETEIEYKSVKGFFFPVEIRIKTKENSFKNKGITSFERKLQSTISFSNIIIP